MNNKWAPFASLFTNDEILKEIEDEKVISKPILSEEELEMIEKNIKQSFHTKERVKITYYYKGKIKEKNCKIKSIKECEYKIILDDYSFLYFEQVINVKFL